MSTVIKTEAEDLRMLAIVDKLMAEGEDKLAPEENALLELPVGLIHDFEKKRLSIAEERTSQERYQQGSGQKLAAFFKTPIGLFI